MPTPSLRSQNAPNSPVRKLSAYADRAKQAGKKVWHLNIGQPDILTPQHALQAVRDTAMDILAYSPSDGIPAYRNKLPKYYRGLGIELQPENLIVTNGASEGILFAFLACLNEGETVLSPEPLYANYQGFASMAGVHIKPIASHIENQFALPGLEAFKAALTPDVKAILLCNPNNPTGTVYSEEMLRGLAELVREHDLYLLVDEVYREFCYGETPFFSALNLENIQQHVIVLDSISKRYSACGARVGAIVSRNTDLLKLIHKYAETRLSPPTFGQIFAEATLDTPAEYFDTVKAEYQKRRDLLFSRLKAIPGVVSYLPEGAFYIFAQLPVDDADRFCQWLLEDFSYENQTVMLAPGSGFYATPGCGTQEVRIAYVLNCEGISGAMDCLERALEEYSGRLADRVTAAHLLY
jgi:aspartate aminotransferase